MVANEAEYLILRMLLLTLVLADINDFGIGAGKLNELRAHQTVIKDDVALAKNTDCLQRQKFEVARASSNQIQPSRFGMNKGPDLSSLTNAMCGSNHSRSRNGIRCPSKPE
jgi:hypothetical protein